MPEKQVVRFVLLNKKNEVLLAQQAVRGLWHFPGGQVENGEDKLEAMLRELKQETSIICTKATLVHKERINWIDHTETIFCYTGQAKTTRNMRPDGKEISTLNWASIHVAPELPLTETTKLLLQNVSIIGLFI